MSMKMSVSLFFILLFNACTGSTQNPQPTDAMPQPQPHFIYVYDPLCGWCYGFSPVISELAVAYADEATFEIVVGGMVRGDRVGPLSEIAPYIRGALDRVESMSGVRFGTAYREDLMGEGKTWLDSEPACLVHAALKEIQSDLCLPYAAAVQRAIYFDGIAPTDEEALIAVALSVGAEEQTLRQKLSEPYTRQAMTNDFSKSEGMGVQGFPTLFMELDNRRYVLTRGWAPLTDIQGRIRQILAEESSMR
jgi:putative protein-disulfide isomerase